jgi:hypothetical protein
MELEQKVPPKNGQQKPVAWVKSPAKQLLWQLLSDEASYIHAFGMHVDKIYYSEPLFMQYKIESFRTNYRNLAAKVKADKAMVNFDQMGFDKEREKFPRNDKNDRGYLVWDQHRAQSLMKEDVKEKRSQGMKPKDLRETRDEYKAFPLDVFRQHKYQEERKQREMVYWQVKRNKKARQNHEVFVKREEDPN